VQDLIRKPDATAIEDLTRLVSEDEDPTIRSMAVIGLSGARDYEAREALIAALSDDDSFVRGQAVQVLGRIWGEDAVEPLNKAALEHPDPAMRREAALMLRIIRNVEDLESLTPAE
jgi:HEAT repeat protein